jgi:modulator of FtsH protease HflC
VAATESRRRYAISPPASWPLSRFVLLIGYSASFTVYQIEQALVLRFGQPVRTVTEPGLSFKLPLIDRTLKIDNPVIDT